MNPTKKKYSKVAHLIPEVMQMKAEGKSITQIGEIMGLTKQRISQNTGIQPQIKQAWQSAKRIIGMQRGQHEMTC